MRLICNYIRWKLGYGKLCYVQTSVCGNFVMWKLRYVETLFCANFVMCKLRYVETSFCRNLVMSNYIFSTVTGYS